MTTNQSEGETCEPCKRPIGYGNHCCRQPCNGRMVRCYELTERRLTAELAAERAAAAWLFELAEATGKCVLANVREDYQYAPELRGNAGYLLAAAAQWRIRKNDQSSAPKHSCNLPPEDCKRFHLPAPVTHDEARNWANVLRLSDSQAAYQLNRYVDQQEAAEREAADLRSQVVSACDQREALRAELAESEAARDAGATYASSLQSERDHYVHEANRLGRQLQAQAGELATLSPRAEELRVERDAANLREALRVCTEKLMEAGRDIGKAEGERLLAIGDREAERVQKEALRMALEDLTEKARGLRGECEEPEEDCAARKPGTCFGEPPQQADQKPAQAEQKDSRPASKSVTEDGSASAVAPGVENTGHLSANHAGERGRFRVGQLLRWRISGRKFTVTADTLEWANEFAHQMEALPDPSGPAQPQPQVSDQPTHYRRLYDQLRLIGPGEPGDAENIHAVLHGILEHTEGRLALLDAAVEKLTHGVADRPVMLGELVTALRGCGVFGDSILGPLAERLESLR